MPIEKLLAGHHRFKQRFQKDQELFLRLAEKGQEPKIFWIGCSDSRVVPEHITGSGPGELFILRNIANIVPPAGARDHAVGSAIEYAVLHLRVHHIVICAHTECGGIKALEGDLTSDREPHIVRWLEFARPALLQVDAAGTPQKERYLETIKANALLQKENLDAYPCVREAVDDLRLTTHAWLYELHTGNLLTYDDDSREWIRLRT